MEEVNTADKVTETVTTLDIDTSTRIPGLTVEKQIAGNRLSKKPNKPEIINTPATEHSQEQIQGRNK